MMLATAPDAGAFQSTPSGGKATTSAGDSSAIWRVSIHAFRGEGDAVEAVAALIRFAFQSTPSGGKATAISRVAMPCFRQIL